MRVRSFLVGLGVCLSASVAAADEPAKHNGFHFTVGESKLRFYGFTRLDIAFDDSKLSHPQVPQWVKSEMDDAAPSGNVAAPDDPELSIYPKLTRFGFDMSTPAIPKLGNAKPSGKIEIDFYNSASSESRAALRMRHGFFKLAWDGAALTVGQLSDLISPLYPAANNDMIMWNAGNLGDRRPQVRFELLPDVGEGNALALQAMIGQTGVIDGQSLDGGSGPTAHDGADAAVPTLQGRLGWTGQHFWIANQTYGLGVWGHFATEALPEGSGMIAGEDEWTSNVVGFDLRLPLHENVVLQAEGWAGKNLDDLRGGIGQGINNSVYTDNDGSTDDVGRGQEIESVGGWAQLTARVNPSYAVSVGASFDDPEENLPTAGARDMNTVVFLANRITPGGGITIGVDYLNWTTEWTGGLEDGKANRIKLFGQYSF